MAKGLYQRWITEEGQTLIRGWRRSGLTIKEIAEKIGITTKTLYEWQAKYSEISDALKKGKDLCDFEAEEALISLFKGHYVEDTVSDIYAEGTKDELEAGKGRVLKSHVHKTKRWVDPNPTAIIFYLKCRAGWKEQWQKDTLEQKKEEFKYQQKKDAGETSEIEDMDEIEGEIYAEEAKDDTV